jgi:Delta3-Delta2-enoyl-CoA isomerase
MNTIELEFKDHFAIVKLNRPKANAINKSLIGELRETFIKLAESETVKGVILTGQGTIFSAGLDIVELYDYTEAEMDHFWGCFGRLICDMLEFPKPLIAAINGHAPAGGCVLALSCDHRVMAYGNGRTGLNEVAIGVVLPTPVLELARFTVGNRKAAHMIYDAALMNAEESKEYGLVDEACTDDELMLFAETKLRKWMDMPAEPWQNAKKCINQPLATRLRGLSTEEAFGNTISAWWDTENRVAVGKLVAKLTGK